MSNDKINFSLQENQQIVKEILKIDKAYSINGTFLKDCWQNFTREELLTMQYTVTEQDVMKKCHKLWNDCRMQDAYDFFLTYEEFFKSKIETASYLIKQYPHHEIEFFGDVYPLEEIDPIELALCYSNEKLNEIEILLSPEKTNIQGKLNATKDTPTETDLTSTGNELAEQLFIFAIEKGIKVLREPIHINFDLDDVDDIINNYPTSEIRKALEEIQRFDSTIQTNIDMYNTLETARKYLNGRIDEVEEEDWRSYVPIILKSKIAGLNIKDSYDIVLKFSKDKSLPSIDKKLVMDYRFYLENLIFGERGKIVEPANFEEFKEYPFEDYVRHAVESIILPHIEVLEKIEQSNGRIQFVDIWSHHFSDTLKEKVQKRDNYKCVVCDEETNLHVHHKVPRKYGGVNHEDNLVTLCSSCHGAIETADFEHAYRKCMLNAIKSKTSLKKQVDLSKDIYMLKEEVNKELDAIFIKLSNRDPDLSRDLLATIKKVNYIFES